MSEIDDLRATIDSCNKQIEAIKTDIANMEEEKNNVNAFITSFNTNLTSVTDYDLTVGNTWRKNLCDIAIENKTAIETSINSAIAECNSLNGSLDSAISEAWRQIRELEATIATCEARIAAIEAEMALAAENGNNNS